MRATSFAQHILPYLIILITPAEKYELYEVMNFKSLTQET
jgi:hypothetical protein